MTTLYQITDQYLQLWRLVEGDRLQPDEIGARLSQLDDQLEHKAENIAKFVLDIDSDIEAIKTEEVRLQARRRSLENRADWLKQYLLAEMIAIGKEQIKRPTVTISVRINPPSVQVVDADEVPQTFCKVIPEQRMVDKKALLDYFKTTGEVVNGHRHHHGHQEA